MNNKNRDINELCLSVINADSASEKVSKRRAHEFREAVSEIPKVAYHPASLRDRLRSKDIELREISRLSCTPTTLWKPDDFVYDGQNISEEEEKLLSTMRKAKMHNDKRALFNTYMT